MKRTYSLEQKQSALAVLAASGGNLSKASRLLQMPRKTLDYLARTAGLRGGSANRTGSEKDRQEMAAKWRAAAQLNLAEMSNPEKVKKASLKDNTIAAGTAQDKHLLLTGGATEHVAIRVSYAAPNSLRELSEGLISGRIPYVEPKPRTLDGEFEELDVNQLQLPSLEVGQQKEKAADQ